MLWFGDCCDIVLLTLFPLVPRKDKYPQFYYTLKVDIFDAWLNFYLELNNLSRLLEETVRSIGCKWTFSPWCRCQTCLCLFILFSFEVVFQRSWQEFPPMWTASRLVKKAIRLKTLPVGWCHWVDCIFGLVQNVYFFPRALNISTVIVTWSLVFFTVITFQLKAGFPFWFWVSTLILKSAIMAAFRLVSIPPCCFTRWFFSFCNCWKLKLLLDSACIPDSLVRSEGYLYT